MAWIPYGDSSSVGDPDNILRIHGVNAALMRRHYDLYVDLMQRPGALPRDQREMIAVVVSAANGCRY